MNATQTLSTVLIVLLAACSLQAHARNQGGRSQPPPPSQPVVVNPPPDPLSGEAQDPQGYATGTHIMPPAFHPNDPFNPNSPIGAVPASSSLAW